MKYTPATYKEYCNASRFAKVRYKFGVYIQFVSALLLIYLLYFTITNIEEMKANPADYAEEKLGVLCFPPITNENININYNGSIGNITGIEGG